MVLFQMPAAVHQINAGTSSVPGTMDTAVSQTDKIPWLHGTDIFHQGRQTNHKLKKNF